MTFKIFCSKCNEPVLLTFDCINCSTQSENKYYLSLINRCSKTKNICNDCPGQALVGKEVNKNV